MSADLFGMDAFAPRDIAARVADVGVAKARLPLLTLALLGVLAGAFIALGAAAYLLVISDSSLSPAVARVLGGAVFSLGLLLVVVAGAELFTGNNLLAMAWASRRISTADVLRNWVVALSANAVGAAGVAALVWLAGKGALNQGAYARSALQVATMKAQLPVVEALFSGMLCNLLVCMAVWMAMAGRSVTDKAVAILLPITAFVALGFEHSIANLFFFPLAALFGAMLDPLAVAHNLAAVIAGNVIGGSVLVALTYWVIYLRQPPVKPPPTLPSYPADLTVADG